MTTLRDLREWLDGLELEPEAAVYAHKGATVGIVAAGEHRSAFLLAAEDDDDVRRAIERRRIAENRRAEERRYWGD